jgi:hypothetical protein
VGLYGLRTNKLKLTIHKFKGIQKMNFQFKMLVTASLSVCALTACSSKTDLNEKNFTLAIQENLDKTLPSLCIPFAASFELQIPNYDEKKYQAFESAGLISSVDIEKDNPYWVNSYGSTAPIPKFKFKQFTLTAEGKKYYQETDIKARPHFVAAQAPAKAGLCYGKIAVDKVVKWTAPVQNGNAQVVQVTYLYKVNDLSDWAKKTDIQEASHKIKDMLDGVSKKELTQELILTNVGWEAAGTN